MGPMGFMMNDSFVFWVGLGLMLLDTYVITIELYWVKYLRRSSYSIYSTGIHNHEQYDGILYDM